MEVEIQKRNIDCVYFLASPFTCKKGSECEYRHSEIARLNPTDCRYWLNGNCLNPNCAFRHPPLEGLTETLSESVPLPSYSSVPTSKSNVSCYFYFNSYCIKGDHCPFLHDILPAQKVPATASEAASFHSVEQKTSTESDTGPASLEVPANLLEGTPELIKQCLAKEAFQQQPLEERSPSVESSVPECEKPAIKLSDSLLPSVDYVNLDAHLCQDQSSEDLVKECTEADEWWESSPGFDVLVDDGSEPLAYEDNADYLLAQETEERQSNILHGHQLQHDFESSAGYDPRDYPDAGHMYEHGIYDSYDYLDRYNPEYFERTPEYYRERILEPMFHQRRKLPHRAHGVAASDGLDLRDHLRKHRRMDLYQALCDSWNLHSHRRRGHSRECLVWHKMARYPGRFASEVGKNMTISSHGKSGSTLNDHRRHGWLGEYPRSSRHSRSKQKEREAQRRKHWKPLPTLYSEISRGSASKKVKSQPVIAANFSGPKTLAEIKEAKSRAKTNGDGSEGCMPRHLRRPNSEDFEGPKSLNELLKDKRKPVSIGGNINSPTNPTAKQQPKHIISQVEREVSNGCFDDTCYHKASEKQDRAHDSSSFDVDREEDGLHEKLACILAQ
ncbi:zinc finger CCCH domain-containing protein 34 [Elaeis guineensis]|uniref:Zinc finger CCCH domain-containing protein 34 n=1 Tax=Elaeis guineensis var. tenera TaxID=51953 RepID=A0A6I9QTI9_ELAGV|nr:zinc finger CCCH domain-containing protein 34 [Elaeis guineensis]